MKSLREFLSGLITTAASILIVLGAVSISITEGMVFVPTSTPIPSPTEFDLASLLPEKTPTSAAAAVEMAVVTATPLSLNACSYPKGWKPYTLQIGDTLSGLAESYGTTLEKLKEGNCLLVTDLIPGLEIYLPPIPPTSTPQPTQTPSPTRTPAGCGIPAGWIPYTVQLGENLFRIGLRYNTTAAELQRANCLASSDRILAGMIIYVPNVPTSTALPTYTPTAVPTSTALPTRTPTGIPSALPTRTNTPTPLPSAAPTNTSTSTALPSPTATSTPLPTAVNTALPTNTETPLPSSTAVNTITPEPTADEKLPAATEPSPEP